MTFALDSQLSSDSVTEDESDDLQELSDSETVDEYDEISSGL